MLKSISTVLLFLLLFSGAAYSGQNIDLTYGLNISGGVFFNDKLRQGSAGREHQMKMTEVSVSLSGQLSDKVSFMIQSAPLNDEIRIEGSDVTRRDIYRNSGTSIYYTNDVLKEAYVTIDHTNRAKSQFGRITTAVDPIFSFAPYAPHSVLYNSGILNGYRFGYNGSVHTSLAILWGRDRPCLSGNCYLDTDIQEKGNNTPVIEAFISYPFAYGDIYGWAFYNKTGSAPGRFDAGKHNDQRYAVGLNLQESFDKFNAGVNAQIVHYVVGLTESGVQGERSGNQAYDIQRNGWWVSPRIGYNKIGARLTYEQLDRADAIAYRDVAKFDRNHPVMSATESRWIASLEYQYSPELSFGLHYTREDVPFYPVSGDEFGATFEVKW